MLYAITKHFWKVSVSFHDISNNVSMLLTYFYFRMLQNKLSRLFSLPFLLSVWPWMTFLDQWDTDNQWSKDTYKILRSLYVRLHEQTKIIIIAIFIYKKPIVGSGEKKTKGW